MTLRTQAGRTAAVFWVKRVAALLGLSFVLSGGYYGARTALERRVAHDASARARSLRAEAASLRSEIRKARSSEGQGGYTGAGGVSRLQQALEEAAKRERCAVTEFRAASEVMPYLTRFAKTSGGSGWNQVEVQVTLSGKPADVLRALGGLSKGDIPIEFNTLELARDKVNKAGEATVLANVSLRVLSPKEGSA